MTFGQIIAEARKKLNLSQKELAAQIKKEDGQPISAPYLNDIEHDRRSPSSDLLIQQFATILDIPTDVLYYWAGLLPADIRSAEVDDKKVLAAFKAFRKALQLT